MAINFFFSLQYLKEREREYLLRITIIYETIRHIPFCLLNVLLYPYVFSGAACDYRWTSIIRI